MLTVSGFVWYHWKCRGSDHIHVVFLSSVLSKSFWYGDCGDCGEILSGFITADLIAFHDVHFFLVGSIKLADKAACKSQIVRLNLPGILNTLMSNLSTVFLNHLYLLFSSFISSKLLNNGQYILSKIFLFKMLLKSPWKWLRCHIIHLLPVSKNCWWFYE